MRRAAKPPSKAGRVGLGIIALIMMGIGVAYGVTHVSEGIRRTGWTGRHGRLTVDGCDEEIGSRGGATYRCYGAFAADGVPRGAATPALAYLDDTSASAYRVGTVLKVASDGRGTVSPIGLGYVLHAWAALLFVGVAISGVGALLCGTAVAQPAGAWHRVSTAAVKTGLAMFGGGTALALLLALISLF